MILYDLQYITYIYIYIYINKNNIELNKILPIFSSIFYK